MTKLPGRASLDVLTDDNVALVVSAHIAELGRGVSKDRIAAENFINAVIEKKTLEANLLQREVEHKAKNIEQLLKYIPHVAITLDAALEQTFTTDWFRENDMAGDWIFHDTHLIYLFESHDDAMLFKLRWS